MLLMKNLLFIVIVYVQYVYTSVNCQKGHIGNWKVVNSGTEQLEVIEWVDGAFTFTYTILKYTCIIFIMKT